MVEIRWAVSDHRPEPVVQVSIEGDAELTVEVKLGPRRQLGEDQDSVEHLGIGIAVLVLAEPVGDGQLLELTLSA